MTKQKMYCSFCDKSSAEVSLMIAGHTAHICDQCVRAAVETLQGEGHWPVATTDSIRRGLMALAAYIGPKCTDAVTAAMGDSQ
jgi:ATP-dependent Clp protease ATP-binding subunit ClpX